MKTRKSKLKKGLPEYVNYDKVRHLETTILNHPTSVVTKFSMKVILDKKAKVCDYYDLTDTGKRNLFVELVNTYYPLSKTKEFLKQIPRF